MHRTRSRPLLGNASVASENCYLDFDRKSATRSLLGHEKIEMYIRKKKTIMITGLYFLDGLGWLLRTESTRGQNLLSDLAKVSACCQACLEEAPVVLPWLVA